MNAESLRGLVGKWRDLADISEMNSLEADSVGLDSAVHASEKRTVVMRECADELEAALAQAGEGVGPATVIVDAEGVRFGPNCWISHEKITGRSAKYLNERHGVIGAQYMAWVDASLATASINPPEVDSKLIVPGRKLVFPSPGEHQETVAWQRQYADGWNACRDAMLAAAPAASDGELPGMWSHSDFTGGDPDQRSYSERAAPAAQGANLTEEAHQIAFEIGGTDDGDYHFDPDQLEDFVRRLSLAAAPAVVVDEAMVKRAEDVRVRALNSITAYGSAGVEERHQMAMKAALAAALKQGVGRGR